MSKKGKKMKKYMKLSGLAVVCSILVAGAAVAGMETAQVDERTLVDYLNDNNVSFLIVNTGPTARLTTFGWEDAGATCKTIRKAGYNVSNVRNYTAEKRIESNAICKN